MQFQEGECGNIANIARESDNEMRPDRPVPSGCGQNARLRCREACPYSRYGLHPAPGIHRVLATTHHASIIEIGSTEAPCTPWSMRDFKICGFSTEICAMRQLLRVTISGLFLGTLWATAAAAAEADADKSKAVKDIRIEFK